ncbi:hypothetical protein [Streptomyces coeruleorubidus]|uniref:hypothetical protein n=1 Tax=Streptomyces coeruleorubidus TaxID=116188 RepID=UPI0037B1BC9D
MVYPAADGEKTLKDLVIEATNAAFARSKREMFKSSYSNHYRSGLMKLLGVLDFCPSNDQHKPVMEALELIERHKSVPSRSEWRPGSQASGKSAVGQFPQQPRSTSLTSSLRSGSSLARTLTSTPPPRRPRGPRPVQQPAETAAMMRW